MRRIKEPIEFLLEKGLIFEINRRILHPLGLAIEVDLDSEDELTIKVWDCRDDPEGLLFPPDSLKTGKEKIDKYMEDYGDAALKSRQELLGFLEQEK